MKTGGEATAAGSGSRSQSKREQSCWSEIAGSCQALDSQEPGQARGFLDSGQIEWLRQDLLQHRDQPTIVFVHHHPWPLGLEWIDSMRLRNGEELIAVLHEHSRARWLICGHVHLDQVIQRGGITMLTTPSTCLDPSELPRLLSLTRERYGTVPARPISRKRRRSMPKR